MKRRFALAAAISAVAAISGLITYATRRRRLIKRRATLLRQLGADHPLAHLSRKYDIVEFRLAVDSVDLSVAKRTLQSIPTAIDDFWMEKGMLDPTEAALAEILRILTHDTACEHGLAA